MNRIDLLNIVATRLPIVAVFGTNGWSLTKKIGAELGNVLDDTPKGIGNTVDDVVNVGKKATEEVVDFIKNIIGL